MLGRGRLPTPASGQEAFVYRYRHRDRLRRDRGRGYQLVGRFGGFPAYALDFEKPRD